MKKSLGLLCFTLPFSAALAAWPIQLPWMNAHSDSANKTYSTTDYPNAVFVVEAYFDDCHWCHANAPQVNALAAEFKDEAKVQFLDVGVDEDSDSFKNWITSTSPNHPVLKDPNGGTFLSDYNINGYPTTLVLDCHGVEQYRHLGTWDTDVTEIRTAINSALAHGCP